MESHSTISLPIMHGRSATVGRFLSERWHNGLCRTHSPLLAVVSRKLSGLLLYIEHCPPDGNPCTALVQEHPQIPTS
jgi:hypothetical protein